MGKDPARFEYSATKIKIVETDYIVVGPLTSDLQVATGQNLCTNTYMYTCTGTCTHDFNSNKSQTVSLRHAELLKES